MNNTKSSPTFASLSLSQLDTVNGGADSYDTAQGVVRRGVNAVGEGFNRLGTAVDNGRKQVGNGISNFGRWVAGN